MFLSIVRRPEWSRSTRMDSSVRKGFKFAGLASVDGTVQWRCAWIFIVNFAIFFRFWNSWGLVVDLRRSGHLAVIARYRSILESWLQSWYFGMAKLLSAEQTSPFPGKIRIEHWKRLKLIHHIDITPWSQLLKKEENCSASPIGQTVTCENEVSKNVAKGNSTVCSL